MVRLPVPPFRMFQMHTASVGVYVPQGDENLDTLFRRVDQAVYRAKSQGGA